MTNNIDCRFCYLGNELFYAFCLFVVRKGDKSNIITNIVRDFLNGAYSIYELLDLEDVCIKKNRQDDLKLAEKSIHICIDKDLYHDYSERCAEYGVSPMIIGRALVLKYVKDRFAHDLAV